MVVWWWCNPCRGTVQKRTLRNQGFLPRRVHQCKTGWLQLHCSIGREFKGSHWCLNYALNVHIYRSRNSSRLHLRFWHSISLIDLRFPWFRNRAFGSLWSPFDPTRCRILWCYWLSWKNRHMRLIFQWFQWILVIGLSWLLFSFNLISLGLEMFFQSNLSLRKLKEHWTCFSLIVKLCSVHFMTSLYPMCSCQYSCL